jgi:hypothetical protein
MCGFRMPFAQRVTILARSAVNKRRTSTSRIAACRMTVYVKEYVESGFRGPLAWWRKIDRGWVLLAPFAGAAVTVPALYMVGDRDFVAAVFSQDIAKQSALVLKLRPRIMLRDWTARARRSSRSPRMPPPLAPTYARCDRWCG